jgi:hypothetical protein
MRGARQGDHHILLQRTGYSAAGELEGRRRERHSGDRKERSEETHVHRAVGVQQLGYDPG